MKEVRFSVTMLEGFKYFMENEDGDFEKYVKELKEGVKPNPLMEEGTNIGACIENIYPLLHTNKETGEVNTPEEQEAIKEILLKVPARSRYICYRAAIEVKKAYPNLLAFEVKNNCYIPNHIDGTPIKVVGKADALEGGKIIDFKRTSNYNATKYMKGYQWLFYPYMYDVPLFDYFVLEVGEIVAKNFNTLIKASPESIFYLDPVSMPKPPDDIWNKFFPEDDEEETPTPKGTILKDIHKIEMYKPQDCEQQCELIVNQFYDFLKTYDLLSSLPEKDTTFDL